MLEMPNRTTGRTIKFTPERIEQIKNLVERGCSREQIAETIDVTVGSLQVTCSRLGISLRLRRPSHIPRAPRLMVTTNDDGNGKGESTGRPAVIPATGHRGSPLLFLVIEYGDQEKRDQLRLPDGAIERLALEASFRGMSMSQLISEFIVAALNRTK
jgi:hypothetical protein